MRRRGLRNKKNASASSARTPTTAPTVIPAVAPPLKPDQRDVFGVGRLAWVTFVVLELGISVVVTRGAEMPAVDTITAVLEFVVLELELCVVVTRGAQVSAVDTITAKLDQVEVELEVAVVEWVLRSSGGGAWKVSSVGIPHPPTPASAQQAQRFVAGTKTTSDVPRKGWESGTA